MSSTADVDRTAAVAIDDATVAAIQGVRHFSAGGYGRLDIPGTLEFYRRRYVDQLAPFRSIDGETVIADVGAGYGWLAMAFALHTPAKLIAIEMDAERLAAGRAIAGILGIEHRISWRAEGLGGIALANRSADVVYCIEVLEHVDGSRAAVADLARLPRDLLIVTTPNKWFPVIAHDTRLPFCHMLPLGLRKIYARAFHRQDSENDNIFWSPPDLRRELADFEPVSDFLHYRSPDDYFATYPFYLPYIGGGNRRAPGLAKRLYYRFASRLGRNSCYVMPNLAGVYRRSGTNRPSVVA
jgi:2-polyprenyl-3-methyl-5-hydroxy-6-metoxy-1,4-benzoquinol methylase